MKQIDSLEMRRRQLEILDTVAEFCDRNGITYWLDWGTLLGAIRHKGYIPWDDDVDIGMLRADYDNFLRTFNRENGRFKAYSIENNPTFDYPFCKVLDTETVLYEPDMNGNKISVYIDVFVWDNVPDSARQRKKVIQKHRRLVLMRALRKSKDKPRGNALRRFCVRCVKWILRFKSEFAYDKMLVKGAKKFAGKKTEAVGAVASLDLVPMICDGKLLREFIPVEFEGRSFKAPKEYDSYLTNLYGDYMTPPPEEQRVKTHDNFAFVLTDEDEKSNSSF